MKSLGNVYGKRGEDERYAYEHQKKGGDESYHRLEPRNVLYALAVDCSLYVEGGKRRGGCKSVTERVYIDSFARFDENGRAKFNGVGHCEKFEFVKKITHDTFHIDEHIRACKEALVFGYAFDGERERVAEYGQGDFVADAEIVLACEFARYDDEFVDVVK